MRAMQVADFGEPLRLVDAPLPEPGPGEVRVAVHRAAVNYPDLLLIAGRYQARPPVPFGPGFEVAGIVDAVGDGVDRFASGDRVVAFVSHGGYAEWVTALERNVFPLPEEIPFDVGTILPVAYGTGYHALVHRARIASGEILVVLGASGGVGLAAVDLGVVLGARVLGVVGAEWKAEVVAARGAEVLVGYEDVRERVLERTGGRGADVVYDPVGGPMATEALRYLAWQGRLLVIGFTSGTIPELAANRLLLKELSAVGVFWGAFAERDPEGNRGAFAEIVELVLDGRLHPTISETIPLEEAPAILERLERRQVVGKSVLVIR